MFDLKMGVYIYIYHLQYIYVDGVKIYREIAGGGHNGVIRC